MAAYEAAVDHCSDNASQAASYSRSTYGNLQIFGNAKVHLGDNYKANSDLFEQGSEEQKRSALLNVLHYDDVDLKREQLALTDIGPKSFTWINGTLFPKWLDGTCSGTIFWINGKPGSGKSTLMKFLADARSTLDSLTQGGSAWTIVHFFFDYRAGRTTANKVSGMLISFLRQLSLTILEVRETLSKLIENTLENVKTEKVVDLLVHAIRVSQYKVCAFIDGLDEYEADLWELCSSLELLQTRTGMKMCLASRPERAFEESFKTCPSIIMQDHNQQSILAYANRKISKTLTQNPFIEDLFTDSLLDAVVEKSQGVILWARLVVDEMTKSCDEDSTTEDLMAFLNTLPVELEPLYERILNKTNPRYQSETAMVLALLVESDSAMKAATLFQAWEFLDTCVLQKKRPTSASNFSAYEARVKALLGNLVDFVRPNGQPVSTRLVHRSLSIYLLRGGWIDQRLNAQIQPIFASDNLQTFVTTCIQRAAVEASLDVFDLERFILTKAASFQATKMSKAVTSNPFPMGDKQPAESRTTLLEQLDPQSLEMEHEDNACVIEGPKEFHMKWIRAGKWSNWVDLLLHCVDSLSPQDGPVINAVGLGALCESVPITLLHYLRCKMCSGLITHPMEWRMIWRCYRAGSLDIVVFIMHGAYSHAITELELRRDTVQMSALETLMDLYILKKCFPAVSKSSQYQTPGEELLRYFFDQDCHFDARHLCLVGNRGSSSLVEYVVDMARSYPPSKRTHDHHRDCTSRLRATEQSRHALSHWIEDSLSGDHITVELITSLAIDPNLSMDNDGSSLFHIMLKQTSESYYHDFTDSLQKLHRLHDVGARPSFEGGRNDIVEFAKALYIQNETRRASLTRRKHVLEIHYRFCYTMFHDYFTSRIEFYRLIIGHFAYGLKPEVSDSFVRTTLSRMAPKRSPFDWPPGWHPYTSKRVIYETMREGFGTVLHVLNTDLSTLESENERLQTFFGYRAEIYHNRLRCGWCEFEENSGLDQVMFEKYKDIEWDSKLDQAMFEESRSGLMY